MDLTAIIITVFSALFGGGIGSVITFKATRKKAGAEAKGAEATAESTELDNVEKAIKIWREMAEKLKTQLESSNSRYEEVAHQVEALRKEVQKLNLTNQKILKLLDKISHDNLESTVEEIKNEIKKQDA